MFKNCALRNAQVDNKLFCPSQSTLHDCASRKIAIFEYYHRNFKFQLCQFDPSQYCKNYLLHTVSVPNKNFPR